MNEAAQRLRQALDMHDAGMAMLRLRLQRDHPEWREAEIDEAVLAWVTSAPLEPGAPVSAERWARLGGTNSKDRS